MCVLKPLRQNIPACWHHLFYWLSLRKLLHQTICWYCIIDSHHCRHTYSPKSCTHTDSELIYNSPGTTFELQYLQGIFNQFSLSFVLYPAWQFSRQDHSHCQLALYPKCILWSLKGYTPCWAKWKNIFSVLTVITVENNNHLRFLELNLKLTSTSLFPNAAY